VAVLLSAVLALSAGGSSVSIRGALRGPVAAGAVTGGLGVVMILLGYLSYKLYPSTDNYFGWTLLEWVLLPVLVGLASALVAQSHRYAFLALWGAALGWIAATIANLIALLLGPSGIGTEGGTNGVLVLGLIFLVVYGGFGGLTLALLGGLIGRGLGALAG